MIKSQFVPIFWRFKNENGLVKDGAFLNFIENAFRVAVGSCGGGGKKFCGISTATLLLFRKDPKLSAHWGPVVSNLKNREIFYIVRRSELVVKFLLTFLIQSENVKTALLESLDEAIFVNGEEFLEFKFLFYENFFNFEHFFLSVLVAFNVLFTFFEFDKFDKNLGKTLQMVALKVLKNLDILVNAQKKLKEFKNELKKMDKNGQANFEDFQKLLNNEEIHRKNGRQLDGFYLKNFQNLMKRAENF